MPTVRNSGLLLALIGAAPSAALAQESAGLTAFPPKRLEFVTVTAGERYAASDLERALLGARYRDLWTTPIQVPMLDLESYAGGLTAGELGESVTYGLPPTARYRAASAWRPRAA